MLTELCYLVYGLQVCQVLSDDTYHSAGTQDSVQYINYSFSGDPYTLTLAYQTGQTYVMLFAFFLHLYIHMHLTYCIFVFLFFQYNVAILRYYTTMMCWWRDTVVERRSFFKINFCLFYPRSYQTKSIVGDRFVVKVYGFSSFLRALVAYLFKRITQPSDVDHTRF